MTDLTALEEAAKKATPGSWECDEVRTSCGRAFRIGTGEMLKAGKGCCIIYDDYPGNPDNERKANATFIALASPSTILSLISTIRNLEREKDEALKAGMLRAAEIAEENTPQGRETVFEEGSNLTGRIIAASIRAEAKGSGG